MKPKLIALSIFAVTAVTVTFFPTIQSALAYNPTSPVIIEPPTVTVPVVNVEHPKIEVVFVLDTTGSMSGLINSAKEKIWSIASTMASAQNSPDIKMGLVAYRDRGDEYITQRVDLSSDLDSMYAQLMDFEADGGGDSPESVNQALDDAVNKMTWSHDQQSYKVVFLVGDAPAHMDYQDDMKYPEIMSLAKQKGIIINTIQAGLDSQTTRNWQHIARLGKGDYFQVEQTGNAIAISSPYDREMAVLSERLDDTRLYYGDKKAKEKQQDKVAAARKLHKEASDESRARRAEFNAAPSGKTNFLGEGELVEAIASGSVALSSIQSEDLPESMQAMAVEEQESVIRQKAKERDTLQAEMKVLADKRNEYLKQEVSKAGGKKDSFDAKIFGSIRAQASEKGLEYDDDSARY